MKLVWTAIAVFGLASCEQRPPLVEDMRLCQSGSDQELRERLRACDRMFGEFEEGSSAYGVELIARARAKEQGGDAAGALDDYTAALEIIPDSGSALLGRGRLLLASGDFEAAKATLDRSIELHDSVIARDMLGGQALLRGDTQEALAYYSAILDREGDDPMDVTGYYGRGVSRLRLGDEGGRSDIVRAVEMNPRVAEGFEERGIHP